SGELANRIVTGAVVDEHDPVRPRRRRKQRLETLQRIQRIAPVHYDDAKRHATRAASRGYLAHAAARTRSYNITVSRATDSQVKLLARHRPRAMRSRRSWSSSHTRPNPSAIDSSRIGSTRTAAPPATSGMDEQFDVTTGQPL